MACMNLKIIVFKKKQVLINFSLFLFCSTCYLFSLTRPRYTTYWRLRKAGLNTFWGQNMALRLRQRFLASFHWFFLSLFVVFFRSLGPAIEAYVIINILRISNCHLMVCLSLKLIVFRNEANFFYLCCFFVLFCLKVTEPFYRVVPFLFL